MHQIIIKTYNTICFGTCSLYSNWDSRSRPTLHMFRYLIHYMHVCISHVSQNLAWLSSITTFPIELGLIMTCKAIFSTKVWGCQALTVWPQPCPHASGFTGSCCDFRYHAQCIYRVRPVLSTPASTPCFTVTCKHAWAGCRSGVWTQ
jgi:hypothetical protein